MRVFAISTLLAAGLVAVPASAQVLGGDVVGPTVGTATGAVGAGVGGGSASAEGAIGGGVQAPSVQTPNPGEAVGDVLDTADSATRTVQDSASQSVSTVQEVEPSISAESDAHASHDQGHVSAETGVSVEADTTEPE